MPTYIALLRGINVSGQKKIKMAELREHLNAIGLEAVQTYIQSGNILFEGPEKPLTEYEQLIKEMIQTQYGFEVPVMVRKPETFTLAIEQNPFIKDHDSKRIYITFLASVPTPENLARLDGVSYDPEEYDIKADIIHFYSPKDYGRAKMSNNFFEKKLKVAATTRNWRTVNILRDMAYEK